MAAVPASVDDPLIQQTLLGEAVDGAPAAIFVLGDDRKYVAVNDYACRLLGYTRRELLSLDPEEVTPGSDLESSLEELRREGMLRGTTKMRTKSGELIGVTYRTSETTAARMHFWVSIAFPE
jgi:PAS domain S-box-containing protein